MSLRRKTTGIFLMLALSTTTLVPLSAPIAAEKTQVINNDYWWPNRLDLSPLRTNSLKSNPMDKTFDYKNEFAKLDLDTLKEDLEKVMTASQDWWPADYGHYGPFFIRMAWHSAGTYRTVDGRGGADGGMQRFAPLNSWPDNTNLDKAQRLLWPIKKKYGNKISWGDLMVLAGTVAMEDMGFETYGFAGGRIDGWEPEDVNWGSEGEWLGREGRHDDNGMLKKPLGAARMGLIYVNPEGPNGVPDPLLSAKEIRDTFSNMAMSDEETVALIAGGHTFGKAHGAANAANLGKEPEGARLEDQGLGWKNNYQSGKGEDTITSGLEGAWTAAPTAWTHMYLQNLYAFEWQQVRSPAGAIQWEPKDEDTANVPDAHITGKFHKPIMFTTDLALRYDPEYGKITKRWLENPEEFGQAFARAWFKLTHRDLGPRSRYLGAMVPSEPLIWQDPVPLVNHNLITERDVRDLKNKILNSELSISQLVRTAWASASTYRNTDMRGGANGARLLLAPQKNWAVNNPSEISKVANVLGDIQVSFNESADNGKKVSMADLIVLGGAAAIEKAAANADITINVPFLPGRTDATQEMTDVQSVKFLRPAADGFRNYFDGSSQRNPADMLIEKASKLNLSVPEMTVLIGGMRTLNANINGSPHGVFTDNPGTLNNEFFVNLLGMKTEWKKSSTEGIFEGYDRYNGELKYTATTVDLIFGSNSELRAVAEVYAFDGSNDKFVKDFAVAWTKVMNLDRF
ncbi:catalase/peroxidase HPI [Emcibacteraceae bacterium]|nr:catalase/peroxidase HPI [Emcibacteraceae bacterium]